VNVKGFVHASSKSSKNMSRMHITIAILGLSAASGVVLGPKSTSSDVLAKFRETGFALGPKSTGSDVLAKYRAKGLPPYVERGGTAVVTGGNSGLGLQSVAVLLKAGCRVVLCSRDANAGRAALASLEGVDTSRARVQQLDLADLNSIAAAHKEIAETERSISLLLNNAGVMACPQQQTKQGFELQIGTNHIGHFALTRLLLPFMEPDGRVVTVASIAHGMGEVDASDLDFVRRKYTKWGAYGQSKGANILFAKGLADELLKANSEIVSVSLHPGVIATPLWRHGNFLATWLISKVYCDKDEAQGASTQLYACLAPAEALPAGAYLMDCALAMPNAACADETGKARKALWEETERRIAAAGLALPNTLLGGAGSSPQ